MNERITELLDQTNLNWTVRKENIQTESGIILDKMSAIVREDTNVPLSVCSNGYYPYQNHELLELLDKVSKQTGLPIHKGGYFGNGEKIYIQLKSNNLKLGTDRIEGYITGINSFDGSTSLAFGNSNITISCQNSFFMANRELSSKVRHTKNMMSKVDEICRKIDGSVNEEKEMFDSIIRLSETRIGINDIDNVIRNLFNIEKNVDLRNDEQVSTVTRNKLSRFHIDLRGEINEKGDNLWGLFSGVTKYTTHSLTKGDNSEMKLFGTYGNREREIYQELVELV
jgi:hypothetical protein